MKKRFITCFVIATILSLAACSNSVDREIISSPFPTRPATSPLNLSGQWKQIDGEFDSYYYGAVISDNLIEIYFVNVEDETRGLYWTGSFDIPNTSEEPYSWFSKNDKEKAVLSISSSRDDTKAFTYENGQISYVASSWGDTFTVHLEKEDWAPDLSMGEFYVPDNLPLSMGGIEFSIPSYFKEDSIEPSTTSAAYRAYMGDHEYAALLFGEIDCSDSPPSSQQEIEDAKDILIRELNPEGSEILETKDILLAGLSGSSFMSKIINQYDVEFRIYTCFAFNTNCNKFVFFYLYIPDSKDNTQYFNQFVESAKLAGKVSPSNEATPIGGIRPEFKDAMDSCEAFFDEYVAFMQRFSEADNSLSLLADYADYMSQYAETMEKFSAIGEEDMSTEEALYYIDVSNRITKKLLEAM